MAFQRACDLCGFARQAFRNGALISDVIRYGLTRQIRRPDGKNRPGRANSVGYTKQSAGGLDLCSDCRDRVTSIPRTVVTCAHCGFTRETRARYGLSSYDTALRNRASIRTVGKRPVGRLRWGSVTLCDECWGRLAKPNMRPELRGKTGPAVYRGRVTDPARATA